MKRLNKIFALTFLCIILTAVSSPLARNVNAIASNDPTVYFSPYRILGTTVGQTVTVSLMISNVQNLWAFQAGLLFNPKIVECTNVVEGGFLSNHGKNVLQPFTGSIDNTNGIVYFYGWSLRSPESPISGSGPLMNVTFQVLAVGYSDIHVTDWIPLVASSLNDIPTTTIDYFTAPGNGTFGNIVKIASNPEGQGIDPPFGGITEQNFKTISQTIGGTLYHGNMSFLIYSPDYSVPGNGGSGFFNVTIPTSLMSGSWYVTLNGAVQTPVVIALNKTYSLVSQQFTYSSATAAVQILSSTTSAFPAVSISPSSTTIDLGQSQLFTATVSGGVSPYKYQWCLNGAPFSGATGSTWMFIPSFAGIYSVYVNVTDANGNTAESNTATATVNPYPAVTISPASLTMSVGQSSNFTSTTSGGTSPYTYQWYLNGKAQSGAVGASWLFTPTSTGSYTVYVNATDHLGVRAKSNTASVTVTVSSALFISISPPSATIDLSQSQTFTSNRVDGFAPFTYQWYANGMAIAGANYSTLTFTPLKSGTYNIFLEAKDASGAVAYSNNATLFVNPLPTASVSPKSVALDIDEPWTFAASAFNGTKPYSYQWYIDGSPVINATSPTWTYTPLVLVNRTVNVNVTDSAGITCMSNMVTVVISSTMNPRVSPASAILDFSQSQLYTATVSGGTAPYSYQWYQWNASGSVPFAGATEATFDFTPSYSGFNIIYVIITDHLGLQVDCGATATVNPLLSAYILPSSVTMDLGQSQTFTSTASGGTAPYSYQWYLNGTIVTGATSSAWTFTPLSANTYNVYLEVTDTLDTVGESNIVTVVVNPPLTILVSPSSVALDINESWTFVASAFNGTKPYSSFQWYLDGFPVINATSATWTYTPLSIANHTIYVTATDNVGFESTSNTVNVTVSAAMNPTISPLSATLDFGQTQKYTVKVSGGTAPYSYQWYQWFPSGSKLFAGANNATFVFAPSIGFNIIYVVITDSHGEKVDWGATATANPQPSAVISPKSVTMDISMSRQFTSIAVNGTPPYTYQWYIDGSLVSTSKTWTYTSTTQSVGTHTVYLIVTDSVNFAVRSNNATIIVNPPLQSSIMPASTAIDLGLSALLTANVTGGMVPYSYQWYVNSVLNTGATGSTFTFTPSSTGSYSIMLVATDFFGFTASNTATVKVNPAPVVTVTPSAASIPLGQHQTFNATTTGGTSPYTYTWYLAGPLVGTGGSSIVFTKIGTGSSIVFTTSNINGYYKLYSVVTDTFGINATSNIAIINGHDVAVAHVAPLKTVVDKGYTFNISINVADLGYYGETFKVTAYANATGLESFNVTLKSGTNTTLTIKVSSTGLNYGHYTISAYAWPLTGEVNTSNNYLTNSTTVTVTIPGDVNGDGIVNIKDAALIGLNWGLTVPPGNPNADILNDGIINIKDAAIVGANWGNSVVL